MQANRRICDANEPSYEAGAELSSIISQGRLNHLEKRNKKGLILIQLLFVFVFINLKSTTVLETNDWYIQAKSLV